MDDMRINITTTLMKALIAKTVSSAIKNKLGHDISIKIGELSADTVDGKAHVHLNIDAEVNEATYRKILTELL